MDDEQQQQPAMTSGGGNPVDGKDTASGKASLNKGNNNSSSSSNSSSNSSNNNKGKGKKNTKGGGGGGGNGSKKKETKKETGLRIVHKKDESFSAWYSEVILKAELVNHYDVSGCYILRPNAYRMWEFIQTWLDTEFKKLDVQNAYFPLFVTKKALEKEADHVEDFSPEVAWVTRSGSTELPEPIAIRPTSETIMYPSFAKWVRSHRDLPLKLNQWTSVVRWEFKNPTPFLRTREFLWQEGHTAYASREEADVEVLTILDLYARVYEELMAVPVIKGRKSDKEKFAGGDFTTTVEAYIPSAGRAIQGATSHSLGQNFSRMFEISFPDELSNKETFAWQNSWGLTTRTIGVMVMVHGDNQGLVLPPKISPVQIVAIPIYMAQTSPENVDAVRESCRMAVETLKAAGFRAVYDDRRDRTAGFKFSHWEQRGVPIRLEVGPRDLASNACVLVRRDIGTPEQVSLEAVSERVPQLLDEIQNSMLDRARKQRDEHLTVAWNWKEFVAGLEKGHMVLAPWCLTTESEEWVKDETKRLFESVPTATDPVVLAGGDDDDDDDDADATDAAVEAQKQSQDPSAGLSGAAKSLCIPFNQPPLPHGTQCFTGMGPARQWGLFGRSY